ncbi:hypothetical protein AB5N19_12857 [Seiridium cardinale]
MAPWSLREVLNPMLGKYETTLWLLAQLRQSCRAGPGRFRGSLSHVSEKATMLSRTLETGGEGYVAPASSVFSSMLLGYPTLWVASLNKFITATYTCNTGGTTQRRAGLSAAREASGRDMADSAWQILGSV